MDGAISGTARLQRASIPANGTGDGRQPQLLIALHNVGLNGDRHFPEDSAEARSVVSDGGAMADEYFTRADLLAAGFTRRSITRAVRSGELVHVRRDRYLASDADGRTIQAVRVGGRLTCLSLLRLAGVYVQSNEGLHVQVRHTDGRLRSPHVRGSRLRSLDAESERGVVVHWSEVEDHRSQRTCVSLVEALVHAAHCQSPRAMVATLDSVLNLRLLTRTDVRDVLARLPRRFRVIEPLLDDRAQSGGETFARLIARSIGCSVEPQARIRGVGYVDLLLDGWLVVECDSRQFHSSWEAQLEDMRRDLALAKMGYFRIRLTPFDLADRPDMVRAALVGLLTSTRR